MKICPVGAEFLQTERQTGGRAGGRAGGRTDGRTDRQTDVSKPIVASHKFANTSETNLYEGKVRNIQRFQSNDAENIM
jgi:hypothetical protein